MEWTRCCWHFDQEFPADAPADAAAAAETPDQSANSTLSTSRAKFMTLDIKNFYYNTPMARYEYMKIALDLLLDEIIRQYGLADIASNGWIYMEIRKGMPGLKQAGRIVNAHLNLQVRSEERRVDSSGR